VTESRPLPRFTVPRIGPDQELDWTQLPSLPKMQLADGSGPARQQTKIRLCHDGKFLRVRFDCDDASIWGNFLKRDDPIYEEEAVEVFLAPGAADPARYFEFEVSPDGVLWDGIIDNPTLDAAQFRGDAAWNCAGIHWKAQRNDALNQWLVWMALPLRELAGGAEVPTTWRANFYRIDRPFQNSDPARAEFSCWSATLTSPASFHQPRRFGILEFA
jgi:hypothetical protein